MPENDQPTTRRALLVAAAGGAAAIAAHAALPTAALAADPNDLVLNQDNDTTADTGVTNATADVDAFHGNAAGTGSGLFGTSVSGFGVRAHTGANAALYATSGDTTNAATREDTVATGMYGYTPTAADPDVATGAGVWGDSEDIGVVGTGGLGIYGSGNWGVEGRGYGTGAVGVFGAGEAAGSIGVHAYAGASDRTALRVTGKAVFSRSGRTAMAAGTYYKTIYVTGATTSSLVFAVLQANRSGRWVRAVVPLTGRFVVYLNTTLTTTTYVAWFVLN